MAKLLPTEYDRYLFHKGTHFQSYDFLGAHISENEEKKGVQFTVWAPNASKVNVIGDFNDWQKNSHPMKIIEDSGIWTVFIPEAREGEKYKYLIRGPRGEVREKADPYAFYAEKKPKTASRVYALDDYNWNDDKWEEKKHNFHPYHEPILIYEVHLGSWRRKEGKILDYREIADQLVTYVNKMGYTHIELLPITEYPFDGSWGYQTTGYFAPTSRYGKPDDFMYFIDKCHQNDIGVIIDWAPSHFCKDDHGLRMFDGTALYESEDPRRAENKQWDTLNFDFAQPEVWSFLISNALFWFKKYHIDGIRADAVSNLLYLDYGKEDGEWAANEYGGNENIEAIQFLRKLNEEIFKEKQSALMIAEESTDWPLVTAPTDVGGLGFNFKWNMGWMNDTLDYMEKDPVFRKWEHNQLTFSIMYTYSENYILPLSHDEVVHGKKSLLDKMPGDYWQMFANLRLLFGYMMAHPGKKLLFMGGEFGQFIEWNYKQELDWHLLEYEKHGQMQDYVKELNHFYLNENLLWEADHEGNGFEWIEPNDYQNSIISFIRFDREKNEPLIVVCNFTPIPREGYKIGVPYQGIYKEVFNSDYEKYGGSGKQNNQPVMTNNEHNHGKPFTLELTLPPLGVVYLKKE